MASDLLLIVKKVLKKLKFYNLIHYRVIGDYLSDSFDNCTVIIRIKKIDLLVIRDRSCVYFNVKNKHKGNKEYFIGHVYEAMEERCPQVLLEAHKKEADIEYALEALIENIGNVKSFLYSDSCNIKLDAVIKQKKKEFVEEYS